MPSNRPEYLSAFQRMIVTQCWAAQLPASEAAIRAKCSTEQAAGVYETENRQFLNWAAAQRRCPICGSKHCKAPNCGDRG